MLCKVKTNYPTFCSKQYVFASPYGYFAGYKRQQSLEIRSQYEFANCQSQGGFCIFMTITHNDKSLYCLGDNNYHCNDVIRSFLINSLQPSLRRKHNGSTCRYLITSEYGEGKGQRSKGNNPHYHCLFFVYPKDNTLNLSTFVQYFVDYFQGSNSISPRDYKVGMISSGSKGFLVLNRDCFTYVSKYVLKDDFVQSKESYASYYIKDFIDHVFDSMLYDDLAFYELFYKYYCLNSVKDFFSKYDSFYPYVKCDSYIFDCFTSTSLYTHGVGSLANAFCRLLYHHYLPTISRGSLLSYESFLRGCKNFIHYYFLKSFARLHFCRPFVSRDFGVSALDTIDPLNPQIKFVQNKSIKVLTKLPTYYYRKIYCNIMYDASNPIRSPRYVHNDTFFKYAQTDRFQLQLNQLDYSVRGLLMTFSDFFNDWSKSKDFLSFIRDIQPQFGSYVASSFNQLLQFHHSTLSKDNDILRHFQCLYKSTRLNSSIMDKVVYYINYYMFRHCDIPSTQPLNPHKDFVDFLQFSAQAEYVPYRHCSLANHKSFLSHPAFADISHIIVFYVLLYLYYNCCNERFRYIESCRKRQLKRKAITLHR